MEGPLTVAGQWMPMETDDQDWSHLLRALGPAQSSELPLPTPLPIAHGATQEFGHEEVATSSPSVPPPAPGGTWTMPAGSTPSGPTTTPPVPPLPTRVPQEPEKVPCLRHRTTSSGSNAHYHQVKCKDCGMLLSRTRRLPEQFGTMRPTTTTEGTCRHRWATWKGSNGFVRIRTCGAVPVGTQGAGSAIRQPQPATTPARMTSYIDDHVELHRDQVLAVLETYDNLVKRRMQDVDGTVSSQQLHEALDLAIAANMSWSSNRGTPPRTTTSASATTTPPQRNTAGGHRSSFGATILLHPSRTRPSSHRRYIVTVLIKMPSEDWTIFVVL